VNLTAIDTALTALGALHTHLCPRQVLGVRLALHAAALLGCDLPTPRRRLIAVVEYDGCFADGVTAAIGCSFGRRTMRFIDHGKVALTLHDTHTGRAVRVCPDPGARVRAAAYAPDATDRWHAQRDGYRLMPADELMRARWVSLCIDLPVSDVHPPPRATCAACGEEVLGRREFDVGQRTLCRLCAGERHVDVPTRPTPAIDSVRA
jgi:formylmethanofuran dehydrogenase subunit E